MNAYTIIYQAPGTPAVILQIQCEENIAALWNARREKDGDHLIIDHNGRIAHRLRWDFITAVIDNVANADCGEKLARQLESDSKPSAVEEKIRKLHGR